MITQCDGKKCQGGLGRLYLLEGHCLDQIVWISYGRDYFCNVINEVT